MGERMTKRFGVFALALSLILSPTSYADTPPARSVNSQTFDGSGTKSITGTIIGPKTGLDVNVINSGGTSTVNQGTPNGGGANAWYVQGSLGRTWSLLNTTDSVNAVQSGTWSTGRTWSLLNSTDSVQSWLFDSTGLPLTSVGGALNANVTNFPAAFGRTWTLNSGTDSVTISGSISATNSANGNTGAAVPAQATQVAGKDGSGNLRALNVDTTGVLSTNAAQSGAWTTGRTWSLLNTTDSVNVGNFPSTYPVTQSTSPWVVSGTVNAAQSGAWTTGRTWSLLNTTDSVNVGNFPATFGATQSGVWSVGRTWNLSSGSDSVTVAGTTTIAGTVTTNQGTSPWVENVSQFGGNNVVTGTGAGGAGIPRVTVSNDSNVLSTQSGAWSTGRTWSLLNTTDSVNAVQSGTWTTGRTWNLSSGADSVAATQSGTWNINNISGTISLPTLAATSTKQSDGSQKTQVVDGAGVVQGPAQTISGTNYMPVVLASSAIPGAAAVARSIQIAGSDGTNAQTVLTDTATTGKVITGPKDVAPATANVTTQDLASTTTAVANGQNFITGSPTANSAASFAIANMDAVEVLVTGTWTGTVQTEVSVDGGTTWTTRGVKQSGSSYIGSSYTQNFQGGMNFGGMTNVRVRAVAAMTGTLTAKVVASNNPASITISNPLTLRDATTQSIANTIKAASTASVAADTSLVVALSPNSPAPASSGHTSVQLVRNDYSSTNVTTAAYVQLIASTSDTTNQLFIFDSSGQTLFLAVGAAASEVNKAYIVPGGNGELNLTIPAGSRVSVKAVSASATSGELSITLLK